MPHFFSILRINLHLQVCGYQGPIYMTHPTKAIMPIMLEDYHKVRGLDDACIVNAQGIANQQAV